MELIQRKAERQSSNRQVAKEELAQRMRKLEKGIVDSDTRKVYEEALMSKGIDINPPIRRLVSSYSETSVRWSSTRKRSRCRVERSRTMIISKMKWPNNWGTLRNSSRKWRRQAKQGISLMPLRSWNPHPPKGFTAGAISYWMLRNNWPLFPILKGPWIFSRICWDPDRMIPMRVWLCSYPISVRIFTNPSRASASKSWVEPITLRDCRRTWISLALWRRRTKPLPPTDRSTRSKRMIGLTLLIGCTICLRLNPRSCKDSSNTPSLTNPSLWAKSSTSTPNPKTSCLMGSTQLALWKSRCQKSLSLAGDKALVSNRTVTDPISPTPPALREGKRLSSASPWITLSWDWTLIGSSRSQRRKSTLVAMRPWRGTKPLGRNLDLSTQCSNKSQRGTTTDW